MTTNLSQRRAVVLDGSNIVAKGENGNDGNILISAIEFYEKLGYRVIPVMKLGTIRYMEREEEPGHNIISEMHRSKVLKAFQQGDDEGVIQIAIKNNAWIVTHDTFNRGKETKDGKKIPSERETHPDWDWDDIDSRTRGTEWKGKRIFSFQDWQVVNAEFFDPKMPKAPRELMSDKYQEFRKDLRIIVGRFRKITGYLESQGSDEVAEKMLKFTSRFEFQLARLEAMIPHPELPEKSEVNNLLLSECKNLIRQINENDSEAKLILSGKKEELQTRINTYVRRTNTLRTKMKAQALNEKAQRKAKEAGMRRRRSQ